MNTYRFSIQRFAAFLISLFLLGYFLQLGKAILAPMLFAAFLAFLLKPVAVKFEQWINNRMWAIIITLFSLVALSSLVILVFGVQLGDIIGNFDNIQANLEKGLTRVFRWAAQLFGVPASEIEDFISQNISSWASVPTKIITNGIGSSLFVISSTLLCFLFTFFLLLYRTSLYNFVLYQFSEEKRNQASELLHRIENVSKEYLNGLLFVILILATLNSIGLFLIGIKLAVFWGVLGALLAIIPYVGSLLGGMLPFIYALSYFGLSWQPLAVVIYYCLVQAAEGNIITPKVIGQSVRINPFIAVLALLIGGAFWGIAGMILALPLIAIVKIVFANIEILQPVSELLRDDLYKREHIFEEKYDDERYRLVDYFRVFRSEKRKESRTSEL